jgi:hypothetical protein
MHKTAIIGSIDQLPANEIKLWADSIRKTGYEDDIILLSYRIPPDQLFAYKEVIEKYKIELLSFDYNENAQPLELSGPVSSQVQNHIWRMRFFQMWQFRAKWKNLVIVVASMYYLTFVISNLLPLSLTSAYNVFKS